MAGVEDMEMTYEFNYSKILETLSVNTTNRLQDIENLRNVLTFVNLKKLKIIFQISYLDYPFCLL